MSRDVIDLSDIEVLTLTIWGEARGEGAMGRAAVANVVMNRVDADTWYGSGVHGVCLKPWQFSCWNLNDPNRPKMLSIDEDDPVYRECKAVAELALNNALLDVTRGATHYHTKEVEPDWSKDLTPCLILGSHYFYNNVP